ncbi:MFS transporter [Streptomyces marispadix]|uniref:MFS transporter n=1 Tax=Streptomyces marispadix TaxID=2922868 RepID=A0ABS9ST74_9ACTN|nr:MFS transporter [Streptomyces marispadix]MCH6159474.1 MFS transporter [Streptomyces marispadix]
MLRLVASFVFAQGAVSMARPAVSYHALELGAGPRAVGAVFALLPLAVAVPLGRRTDRRRCGPLLPAGAALIAAGCALAGTAPTLVLLAVWSALLGLGHLVFMIGAQSLVARQSSPDRHDRNFGYFTIGGSMGQLIGPLLSGWVVGGAGDPSGPHGTAQHSSAVALFAAGALTLCSYATLWRIEGRTPRERPGVEEARPEPSAFESPDAEPSASPPSAAEPPAGASAGASAHVPVARILRARGVPAGIFASLAVLSTTDVLTAYLPVVGEERGIAPGVVGLLLSLRAAASVLSRAALPAMSARLGRQPLLVLSCLTAGALCVLLAVPVPVWALASALVLLGFCLGVGQPLTMSTVVQAAPGSARSTALALRLTGNRLGQVAAPAFAGLLAGAAGAAAPFVLLGALLLGASGTAARAGPADEARPRTPPTETQNPTETETPTETDAPGTRARVVRSRVARVARVARGARSARVTHGTRRRTDTSN